MPEKTLWQKPRLHENPHHHRKVSWLELFFDLVFVVVISELVHVLSTSPTLEVIGNYLFLFIPAWWIWLGATYYNERFETDGLENRVFTFLLMLPIAGLAIFTHEISSIGYGLCYMLARILLVLMWARAAVHEKRFRPVGQILIMGFGISIALFFVSLWLDPPYRFFLWILALCTDLVTPLFTLKRQRTLLNFSMAKLPERIGLFVLIVMGETLVGVIRGVARHHHFSLKIVSEGIVGVAISFALWWIYFDFVAERQPKNTHRAIFMWDYLHLIFVMAIGAVGASLLHILTSKHHIPTDSTRFLMVSALAVSLVVIGFIEKFLEKDTCEMKIKYLSALLLIALGIWGHGIHSLYLLIAALGVLLLPILNSLRARRYSDNAEPQERSGA
ncbi:MAG: low temperature requirement protein A [Verrucomicrobia bacterium]|nr:low temperature requirement protein A [Verrucomicrobiota bacterium]